MSNITVTMPIGEYEYMKKKIKHLEKERIYNYINFEVVEVSGEPAIDLTLHQDDLIDYIVNNQKGIANVYIKNKFGISKVREITREGEPSE